MIIKTFKSKVYRSNCYLVGSEESNECMIIDPSVKAKTILAYADEMGMSISLIVVTHFHPDHITTLAEIKRVTGADFVMHRAEGRGIHAAIIRRAGLLLTRSSQHQPRPDWALSGGEQINLGELRFNIIHTPGHTPGSICLSGHGVVFTGDTLFHRSIGFANRALCKTGMAGFSFPLLKTSIVTKLLVLPDGTRVLPGHGIETTVESLRQQPTLQTILSECYQPTGLPKLLSGYFLAKLSHIWRKRQVPSCEEHPIAQTGN